jgi:hypothetical protein
MGALGRAGSPRPPGRGCSVHDAAVPARSSFPRTDGSGLDRDSHVVAPHDPSTEEVHRAEADRCQHHVPRRLLRRPGEERHGAADGRVLRRAQPRAAPCGRHAAARRHDLHGAQGVLACGGRRPNGLSPRSPPIRRWPTSIGRPACATTRSARSWCPTRSPRRTPRRGPRRRRSVRRNDAHRAVAELKEQPGEDILTFGSQNALERPALRRPGGRAPPDGRRERARRRDAGVPDRHGRVATADGHATSRWLGQRAAALRGDP